MLEKRKEESESIGKYQSILTGFLIGAIIVWAAPELVAFVFDYDSWEEAIEAPDAAPDKLAAMVTDIYALGVWLIRIVLVMGVMIAVFMLLLRRRGRRS